MLELEPRRKDDARVRCAIGSIAQAQFGFVFFACRCVLSWISPFSGGYCNGRRFHCVGNIQRSSYCTILFRVRSQGIDEQQQFPVYSLKSFLSVHISRWGEPKEQADACTMRTLRHGQRAMERSRWCQEVFVVQMHTTDWRSDPHIHCTNKRPQPPYHPLLSL